MEGEFLRRNAVIKLAQSWGGPMKAADKPKAKRRMDIEAALRWAYVEELPKEPTDSAPRLGYGNGMAKTNKQMEELALVIEPNAYGVIPDRFAAVGPCSDALRIHAAVCALDEFDCDMPEGWPWLGEDAVSARYAAAVRHAVLRVERAGRARFRFALPHLVQHHAIMSTCPDWDVPAYERDVERYDNGKPKYFVTRSQWVDGAAGPVEEKFEVCVQVSDLRRHPEADELYMREILEPDPTDALVDRARYEVWRAALDVLAVELEDGLDTIEVMPSARAYAPWEDGERPAGRVLPDLTQKPLESLRLRKRRKKTSSAA